MSGVRVPRSAVLAGLLLGLVLVAYVAYAAYGQASASASGGVGGASVPRNVIFLIGDGMGPAYIRLAELAYGPSPMWLVDGRVGVLYTDSMSGEVTDSAAAGTAFAAGFLTENGRISMTPLGDRLVPVTTVLELAKALGKSTGLVTTTRITHATPAVFAAHVADRNDEGAIAVQLIEAEVDVLLGGGRRYFNQSLLERARRMGYTVVSDRSQLLAVEAGRTARLLGLFADSHMPFVLDRDGTTPSLLEMARKAIEVLERNPNGFFLMVEGGRIDHAGHLNDAASALAETKEFLDVAAYVLDYAARRGDTLVVIFADHETGGLTVGGLRYGRSINMSALLKIRASVERMADLISRGGDPAAVVLNHTGIRLTQEEAQRLAEAVKGGRAYLLGRTISEKVGIAWSTDKHNGVPVLLYAYGPGSHLFQGFRHHVDIARYAALAMLFGANATTPPNRAYRAYTALLHYLGSRCDSTACPAMQFDVDGNGVVDLADVYSLYRGETQAAMPTRPPIPYVPPPRGD